MADALAGDGVEEQASVADERPARAVRLAEVAGQVRTAAETLGPAASVDPVAEADRVQVRRKLPSTSRRNSPNRAMSQARYVMSSPSLVGQAPRAQPGRP
jgi:hypothetical protein